jgi:hypothetical protein
LENNTAQQRDKGIQPYIKNNNPMNASLDSKPQLQPYSTPNNTSLGPMASKRMLNFNNNEGNTMNTPGGTLNLA